MTIHPATDLLLALLIGAVSFRLWRLIAQDSITYWFHGRLRASAHPVVQWFDTLVSCPWCLGWWCNVATTWLLWWATGIYTWLDAILITFAASTITGLTASIDERLHD